MFNFHSQPTVKKGNIGEDIIRSYLESKGFIVYKPVTNLGHLIDFVAIKNKSTMILADAKCKARMNYYNATGIDSDDYRKYQDIESRYGAKVFLFFIDEHPAEQRVYGNWLSVLSKQYESDLHYPNTTKIKNVILFSLDKMKHIADLSADQVKHLQELSVRNYSYE